MLKMMPRILDNLFGRPVTRDYPRKVRAPFAAVRGRVVNDPCTCIGCGICAQKCPSGCIRVDRHAGQWIIEPDRCIGCGVCVENCRQHSLHQENTTGPPMLEKLPVVVAIETKANK
ncbi:4Fe-4S ferredoxin iron-sulfur binding domain protein [Desulfosarcina cetonica]|uniref:4Fe-4S binding protein n=1 Tax=Desulfosarcina cetonica TaxID=90730 RepID=UPI0006D140EA|nr:4Fe-4S binding protein [Desulfosarcina cetonica]VTR65582.1 4Fe-4S ferredoxin iron-sulfur binding domain protein [Desulfosarcina cetonica]